MARNAGWLWGLVPLALLWASANVLNTEPVRRDIETRALAANAVAGAAAGARGVSVRVSGRDVYLDGEAVTTDGASKALAQLQSEFGVRRVLGGLTQVIAQKPYSWSATRQGNLVTLSGFVPDEAIATASVSAARALGTELRVDDQQKVAFGAPPGFAELAGSLMRDLGQLSAGKVALDDSRYCVEGTAATPRNFLNLREVASTAAPKGFTRVDCALSPPTMTPYRWSVEKSAAGAVTIAGYYPSDAARREIAALLARAFPAAGAVTDRTLPAAGEPQAFATKVARAIADLARLRSGKVEIEGGSYRISGQGPETYEACEALKLNIAQGDGPDSVALASIACPPAPPPTPTREPTPAPPTSSASPAPSPPNAPVSAPPPQAPVNPAPSAPSPTAIVEPPPLPPAAAKPLQWRAEKSEVGIVLSGAAPDAAAKAAALEAARAALSGGDVVDRTVLEDNPRGRRCLWRGDTLRARSPRQDGAGRCLAGRIHLESHRRGSRQGWLAGFGRNVERQGPPGRAFAFGPAVTHSAQLRLHGFDR
ncbi:hypothetical protein QO058_26780 [Bosea vestrisii]|uniref:hypothetical protein n=1 Tax=Bosea vestrisii TaxID=151416 RepID=UPI0024DF6066|nr:hypothetical protein [Bosea vestrisii]WID96289.1 hypothetical protein QO058_26780 [Bosea vestrisii]